MEQEKWNSEKWNRRCVRTIDQIHLLSSRELSASSGSESGQYVSTRRVFTDSSAGLLARFLLVGECE